MDFSAASWSKSIIDVLKTTKCPEVRERARVRGEKIKVEPGKSDGSDSESSNDGSNSYESSDEEVDGNVIQSPPTKPSMSNYCRKKTIIWQKIYLKSEINRIV